MTSSDERREVAARLRELASENQGTIGSMRKMQEVMTQAHKITGTMYLPSVAHVLERYADLIDPIDQCAGDGWHTEPPSDGQKVLCQTEWGSVFVAEYGKTLRGAHGFFGVPNSGRLVVVPAVWHELPEPYGPYGARGVSKDD